MTWATTPRWFRLLVWAFRVPIGLFVDRLGDAQPPTLREAWRTPASSE